MRIIIVGDGKVGLTLTKMLTAEDHDLTVIDSNPKVLEHTQEVCDTMAVVGHGASRRVLEEAGAAEADLLIAATSQDEVNLLSCLMAKKLGTANTIARVRNPEYAEDLPVLKSDLGLSYVINPEEQTAREIYSLLQIPSFLGRERFAKGRVEIVKIKVTNNCPLNGLPLTQLYSVVKARVLVCAADRGGEIIIPRGGFTINEGDDLFIAAGNESLAALVKQLSLSRLKVRQVTLVGGSRIAIYLSRLLLKSGIGVKIIESNPERSRYLADLLPEADIVEADGTEQDILLSEGIERSDALVALTGIDEENIVLSIYARQIGIPKIITKCNRTQYSDMFRKIGIDTVVSPRLTSAEQVVQYVRAMGNADGGKMVAMHQIADGKAEAMEFVADSSAKMLGLPLMNVRLKSNVLLASITRGGQNIIPNGESIVQEGDNVVVVAPVGQKILDLNDILIND